MKRREPYKTLWRVRRLLGPRLALLFWLSASLLWPPLVRLPAIAGGVDLPTLVWSVASSSSGSTASRTLNIPLPNLSLAGNLLVVNVKTE